MVEYSTTTSASNRTYYYKTYKDGRKVRVKKDEYLAKRATKKALKEGGSSGEKKLLKHTLTI